MGFIGRWLGDSVRLAFGLGLGLLLMQVPAVTAAYVAALGQIAGEQRRDVDRREDVARQFYRLEGATTDEAVIAALRAREPSNAEGLALSVARERALRESQARLLGTAPLLRPVAVLRDVAAEGGAGERAVLRTALDAHEPQVVLGTAAATYGLVGLVLGLLLAQLLVSPFAALFGRRRVAWRPAR